MTKGSIIGIDIGGTNIRAAAVARGELGNIVSQKIKSTGTAEEVTEQLFSITDQLINPSVTAIGIGVPGLVDEQERIVFDVVNIPAWKQLPLFAIFEERYGLPVFINNDANCFALGEFYFGKGQNSNSMIGLTIGTGLGAGIIINKKLYTGSNCGAGEFGTADYLDQTYEYYASGQFFTNVYQREGEAVFIEAVNGDSAALKMYEEMGSHLGNAIKTMMYALDVEQIIIGGSVRKAFAYFEKSMWASLQTFVYKRSIERLKIDVSALENSGILGAAALVYDKQL